MLALVIAGPLGAGKTSLILDLSRRIQASRAGRVGIIENEAGKIDIDSVWLRNQGMEVRELYSGCICCSLRNSLETTVSEFIASYSPEVLIVEPSGIAGPDSVVSTLKQTLSRDWEIKTLYLLDIPRVQRLTRLSPFFPRCLESADALIPTKLDLAGPEEIDAAYALIRSVYEGPIISAVHLDRILDLLRHPSPLSAEVPPKPPLQPPEAAMESRSWRMAGREKQARRLLQRLQGILAEENGAVPGHLKLLLTGKSTMILNVTDINGPIMVRGTTDDAHETLRADLNALVYGIDGARLTELVDSVLREYRYESI